MVATQRNFDPDLRSYFCLLKLGAVIHVDIEFAGFCCSTLRTVRSDPIRQAERLATARQCATVAAVGAWLPALSLPLQTVLFAALLFLWMDRWVGG